MPSIEHREPPASPGSQGGSPVQRLRRLLIGSPLATEHAEHTLLRKLLALPVFSSDAISSVAYATQQIVLALGAAGLWVASQRAVYTQNTLLISGLIVALLAIVVISYWQTIFAYPSGGGSYIVSKDNLGTTPGLVAAAALLIDYVLTVSVSIASGVQNLASIPALQRFNIPNHLVIICVAFIILLTVANLRGLKESGTIFALPTYLFVGMCYLMIALGILGPLVGWKFHPEYVNQEWPQELAHARSAAEGLGIAVLLRAFANGCSAMTGTEAVSNGIPAFREPKSRNAALTLVGMGVILGTIFIGISWLTTQFHVVYWEGGGKTAPAVIDQLSGAIFGKVGPFSALYLITQAATAGILVIAANTSYADFPRLASILARDGFMPKQLSALGDKLVFNNGILLLGVFAGLLIVMKGGNVDALIPLYALGVFLAFTLSQSGMVIHWRKEGGPGWVRKALINGLGAVATFIVLLDIAVEKFAEGAWMVIILIVLLVLLFRRIRHHYTDVSVQLRAAVKDEVLPRVNTVVVLVPSFHVGVQHAIQYARLLSPHCRAVHVEVEPEQTPELLRKWGESGLDIPLVVLHSPYRSLIEPILDYLEEVQNERQDDFVTVVIPEAVPAKWWQNLLHGQTGLLLKLALMTRPDVVVANVRYPLQHSDLPLATGAES